MNTTARTSLSHPPLPLPRCGRCAFTSRPYSRWQAAGLLLEYAARWQRVLADPEATRRCDGTRRYDGTLSWSPLEHGCHVRDMCLLFHRRIDTALGTTSPDTPAPGGPEPPPRYRDEDARRASEELGRAARALAGRLAALTADDWEREDPRFPSPRPTLDFLTRHFLHDIVHSLSEVLHEAREKGPATPARRGTGRRATVSHG